MSERHAIDIFGVPIDDYTPAEFVSQLEVLIERKGQGLVCPVNIDMLNQCYKNKWLHSFISNADLIQAESSGVLLGAKLKGKPLSGKVVSNEIIYKLAKRWESKPYSIYFLGGPEGQSEAAKAKLQVKYPDFKIVGGHRGHLTVKESEQVIKEINSAKPDILMVGFGCPAQEEWIDKYRSKLSVPLIWAIGNITSYVAGTVSTAPQWMKNFGLEWLHRFLLEPKRMWKRYLIGNPLFIFRVLWGKVRDRFN